ncbi:MAG TPA: NADH-quinone oxidoreductase subunit C [Dokdonella sp.]
MHGYALATPPSKLPGPLPVWRVDVARAEWSALAAAVRADGGRLVSLWGSERDAAAAVSAAYATGAGLLLARLALDGADDAYADLSPWFPAAACMQRAIREMLGLRADGARDERAWLNHGNWPRDYHPLRAACSGRETFAPAPAAYPFVRVEGAGVHEIAVGPIHAGIIEPGHFRFSVVGEKVLRLEERLGYVHRGVEKRFEGRPAAAGVRLAGRVSGDSTVAYAWAYAMAVESALGVEPPARAAWLRALMLERERVANHLGDLGALGNDAGFGFGLAQFSRLREDWLRTHAERFGHRLLMDRVVPGGVAVDLDAAGAARLDAECVAVEASVRALETLYDEHAGLQDRFTGTGRVSAELAATLGLCGLAGRASGRPGDLRVDHPCAPYDALAVRRVVETGGDVAARVRVRFRELHESLRLIRALLAGLPGGDVQVALPHGGAAAAGIGWIEGWRGDVLVAVELAADATIARCHCHDPSWQNWPVLEHAILDEIVPDFPLINKSFNLSYAGHDL